MILHPLFSELSKDILRRLFGHFALCQKMCHHLHNYMQAQYWRTEMVTRTRDMLLIRHAVTVIIIRPDGVIGVEGTKQYFDGMFDA
jgi:hypothetical protein